MQLLGTTGFIRKTKKYKENESEVLAGNTILLYQKYRSIEKNV